MVDKSAGNMAARRGAPSAAKMVAPMVARRVEKLDGPSQYRIELPAEATQPIAAAFARSYSAVQNP